MKNFLLSEVTGSFLYLTTLIGVMITLMLGMCEAPDKIITPIGIVTCLLIVISIYYGTWRGIMRERGV
jgi:hypothetical protein